jgi:hypothetical protein
MVCTAEVRSAVLVLVKDSLTDAWAISGSKVIAQSGTYLDSVSYPAADPSIANPAGFGRQPGTYSVRVQKLGYRDWSKQGIVVGTDKCGTKTEVITARLAR